jgi:IMP dehydrogenase/GMP reductase
MKVKKGYKFSDVLMVPRKSKLNSRGDPKLEVRLGNEYFLPIIASPMQNIIGVEVIKELNILGGLGILHRFWKSESDRLEAIKSLRGWRYGVAVGVNEPIYPSIIEEAFLIVIDVANGYINKVLNRVESYKLMYPEKFIMAGNVVTKQGARRLKNAGADLVRVGIGNGSLCTTRDKTGVGYPQLSAIEECSKVSKVVADGGMNDSGDMAKAFAAGAEFVMVGGAFGRTYESPNSGTIYGMASKSLLDYTGKVVKSVEGREIEVEKNTTVRELVESYVYGIKSAMTYLDAANLKQLRKNVKWVLTN